MKVAHIIGKMKNAGVESVVFTYIRHMPSDGIDIDILYDADSDAQPPDDLVRSGVRFIEIPPYQKITAYLSKLVKIFKREQYDIVHSHMNVLSVFPLWAAKKAGIKCRICHNHTMTSPAEPKRNALKLILRPFSKFVATDLAACSELCGRWMFGDKRYDGGKVKLFYNAIDIGRFRYNEEARRKLRAEFNLGDSIVLGHVGRFFDTKNHGFLIDILDECKKRGMNVKLLLVGDGETKDAVKQKAETLGLSDDVVFAGVVNDAEKYYSAMDMFLLPSFYEGLPVVSLEAQAAGLECIISDAVTRECAITERVHFLPITDGAGVWADAVCAHEETYRIYGDGYFENSKFNIDNSARDMVQYYNDILSGEARKRSVSW